jgi:hypothetical protein
MNRRESKPADRFNVFYCELWGQEVEVEADVYNPVRRAVQPTDIDPPEVRDITLAAVWLYGTERTPSGHRTCVNLLPVMDATDRETILEQIDHDLDSAETW